MARATAFAEAQAWGVRASAYARPRRRRSVSGRAGSTAAPAAVVGAEEATAFRLRRHHLIDREPSYRAREVLSAVSGAQSQLLSASQLALWTRLRDVVPERLSEDLWKRRDLARAWCMRRTLYLLPSREVALYVRGTSKRAEKEVRWLRNHGVAERTLAPAVGSLLEVLEEPRTIDEIASHLGERLGGGVRNRRGGGWGSRRHVPWVRVGRLRLPMIYLLHVAGAYSVICSGPPQGAVSTYVRADAWLRGFRDVDVPSAERELVRRYLRAFGPATPWDFATWSGLRKTDVDALWQEARDSLTEVSFDGRRSWILSKDLDALLASKLEDDSVRLLPYFDSYLLGHRDHRSVADERDLARVFRPQGWVSQTVLWNGRVVGLWSTDNVGPRIRVRVEPFRRLPGPVLAMARAEAADLEAFLARARGVPGRAHGR